MAQPSDQRGGLGIAPQRTANAFDGAIQSRKTALSDQKDRDADALDAPKGLRVIEPGDADGDSTPPMTALCRASGG